MPTFTVQGANLVSDVDGPTITYVDVSDEWSVAGDDVYVRVGFSDDSAMDRIALGVNNPGGTTQYFNCYSDASSGECEFAMTIGEGHFVQAGEYEIDNVQAYDEHGNFTIELSAYSTLDMPTFTASIYGVNPTISIPSLSVWGMVGTAIGLVLLFIWRAQRRQV